MTRSFDQVVLQGRVNYFSCCITTTSRPMATTLGKVVTNFKPLTHTTLCACAHVNSNESQKHFISTVAIPIAPQQISNSLGDSQNETLITHYEKKQNRNHAKCFLF